ncbi:ribulose-phosphate 3-epimerase [Rhodohalobacter barkolensis]|uniref:Ribulose-phosphate 3-epimerase n=1 Tax=Rhodohalobacter barkolensis TaxID=2053187 RepID=A0A2N0VIR5_9BACT|nr:ribulose-phosphate 3-epimerase [Rhodohalobacter barkolensis]PKD44095.1 ribulose-phosphate 3-epimerase [Rhodohalobacter barkolensis]
MNFDLPILAPSILAADFLKLGDELQTCKDAGINWFHCDIMDGHFVPNISYGPGIVGAVRKSVPDSFLDVHLMIENPDNYIDDFADAGSDLISVHYEACPHLHRTIQSIKQNGCMAGVVINPATSTDLLRPILPDVDLALIMSVNPGFGGQKFIQSSYRKVQELKQIRSELNAEFLIEIDGGVGTKNISKLVETGVDVLVAGSSVFKAEDIPERISELNSLALKGSEKVV